MQKYLHVEKQLKPKQLRLARWHLALSCNSEFPDSSMPRRLGMVARLGMVSQARRNISKGLGCCSQGRLCLNLWRLQPVDAHDAQRGQLLHQHA